MSKFISPFFLMSLAIRENDLNFFPGPNKAILELKNQKWTQKSTIFGQNHIRVLAILGVQKDLFKYLRVKMSKFIFPFFKCL